MSSNRSTIQHSTNSNHHRRQWSEGVVSNDKAIRFYKGTQNDRCLAFREIGVLSRRWSTTDSTSDQWISLGWPWRCVRSYSKLFKWMLRGDHHGTRIVSMTQACFEFQALVDIIWQGPPQNIDNNDDEFLIFNQRSSLLSSSAANVHREGARRRLSILFIEVFKSAATHTAHGGRFDIQRQARLLFFPSSARQLINVRTRTERMSFIAEIESKTTLECFLVWTRYSWLELFGTGVADSD